MRPEVRMSLLEVPLTFPNAQLALNCLNLPVEVNPQSFKMKMVILETEVTVAEQRLGQLRCDIAIEGCFLGIFRLPVKWPN